MTGHELLPAYDVEVSFAHPDPAAPGSAEHSPLLSARRARYLPRPWRLAPWIGNEFHLLVFIVVPAVFFDIHNFLPLSVNRWLAQRVGFPSDGLGQAIAIAAMTLALLTALWSIKRTSALRDWVRTVPPPETAQAAVAELQHFDLDARFPLTRAADWILEALHWLRRVGRTTFNPPQNARETVWSAPVFGAVVVLILLFLQVPGASVTTWVFLILVTATTVALLVRAHRWDQIESALNSRSQALMQALSPP